MPADAIANLLLRVRSDTKEGETGLAGLAASLKAFSGQNAEAEAKIETRKASRVLKQLHLDLAEFSRETAEARADVDTKEARIHLDFLEERLDAINREHVTAEADIQIAKALAKLAVLRKSMSAFAHQGEGIDSDRILKDFITLSGTVGNIARGLHNFDTEGRGFFSRMSTALKSARVNIGPFSTSLANLGRLWLFLIPKALALAASLISIGSAVAGAVAGFAALATSAVAVGGALATISIGAIARFASASQGVKDYRAAMDALRQATEAQKDAERDLRRAQESRDQAQRDLNKAQAEARDTIRTDIQDALAAQATAEYNLSSAQEDQIAAQEALTQAREDARRALVDLRNANRDAVLSEKQARLDLLRAREEAAGFSPDDTSIEARQARLDLAQAEQDLKEARISGQRSEEDLNDAEAKGIRGSDQVVAAREQLASANHAVAQANTELATAVDDLAEAQKATVRQDEGVISARRALQQANEGVTDSQRALKDATREAEQAQKDANKAYRAAAPLLSGAGKQLRIAIREFRNTLEEAFGPGIDALWRGVATSLQKNIGPLVKSMSGAFTRLGQAMGNAIGQIATALNSEAGRGFFTGIIDAATSAVPLLTRGFVALARVFGNIATAAMPFFLDGMESLVELLEDFANATSDSEALGGVIGMLVGLARSLTKLLGAVGHALLGIFRAASGPGQELLDWLTEVVEKWADWANSAEGQSTLKKFFEDMVPLTKGLIDLMVEFIELFINIGTILLPAIAILNKVMTTVLDIVNDILGVFADLPAPIRAVIGGLVLFRGPIRILQTLAGWLGKLLELILGKKLFGALAGLASRFGGFFTGILSKIGPVFTRLVGFAGPIVARLLPAIARIGPALLGIAGPAGIALAAALEWGDDLGRSIADLAGYSDEAIQNTMEVADAQGHLADALFEINRVLRNLDKIGIKGIDTKEDLWAAFSKRQVDRMKDILAHGGTLAGRKWVENGARALRNGRAMLMDTTGQVVKDAASAATDQKGHFKSAGKSLGEALADGIKAAIRAVKGVARGVAQAVRNIFPGSEPKDSSSPLRGLQAAGRAIVANIGQGIEQAQLQAPRRLAAKLDDTARAGRHMRNTDRSRTVHQKFEMPVTVAGGGFPDADSFFAAANRVARGRGIALT